MFPLASYFLLVLAQLTTPAGRAACRARQLPNGVPPPGGRYLHLSSVLFFFELIPGAEHPVPDLATYPLEPRGTGVGYRWAGVTYLLSPTAVRTGESRPVEDLAGLLAPDVESMEGVGGVGAELELDDAAPWVLLDPRAHVVLALVDLELALRVDRHRGGDSANAPQRDVPHGTFCPAGVHSAVSA